MGEQFKRCHTEQFRHQQDAAHEKELKRRTLFSDRPEVFTTFYRCRPITPTMTLELNALFFARDNNGALEVFAGGELIGHVEGGAETMRNAFQKEPRAEGFMKVRLHSQSSLSGFFDIRCAENETQNNDMSL